LTDIDVPWKADDLRDRPNDREKMFKHFEGQLIEQKAPYTILKGIQKERMKQAKDILAALKREK